MNFGNAKLESYFEVFTDMAANNKLHLMQFIVLTEWQKRKF